MPKLHSLLNNPASLLLITGGLLGLTFPFGKLAGVALIPPALWAFLIAAGAGCLLLIFRLLNGQGVTVSGPFVRYYYVSATVSLVIPNLLIFTVIPELGSGFTGLLFTLSPIFTFLLMSVTRLQMPGRLGIIGIAIGFAGALIVAGTRGELGQPASVAWLLAGMCIPASLAVGNIYRTLAWPAGAAPTELAVGSNLAAASLLLLLVLYIDGGSSITRLMNAPILALIQALVAATMFYFYYRLQQVGGPTYLSQISYIAAGVALVSGTLLLTERYSQITWIGAAVIVIGIICSIIDQGRQ